LRPFQEVAASIGLQADTKVVYQPIGTSGYQFKADKPGELEAYEFLRRV
jgi:hypothetical protein